MALPSTTISFPSTSISTFQDCLKSSKRILALLGAGLSASSGLSTFRGVGSDGLWQNRDPAKLATPKAFKENPELVWRFYQDRRKQALEAQPNQAHLALAKFATILGKEGFMTLGMNIDGICRRVGHPEDQLLDLHGSLLNLKCSDSDCECKETSNYDLELLNGEDSADSESSTVILPECPWCSNLLRPDIVWFGEALPEDAVSAADHWVSESEHIDLVFVIGTTAQVWPAAGYVDSAIEKGARVAMVNIDRGDLVPGSGELGLTHRDWFFVGDAAKIVPEMLEPVVGVL